jgi:hypothetical protein
VSEAVYEALMGTLNPTLWLRDQEIQIELNRIRDQSQSKITAKPSDMVDFALTKQVALELYTRASNCSFPPGEALSQLSFRAQGEKSFLRM